MERRLQGVLSLADQNLANSKPVKEQGNGRCSLGMFFIPLQLIIYKVFEVYAYSAWASGVARSTGKGNARAISSGTSDKVQTLTLFSYLWVT